MLLDPNKKYVIDCRARLFPSHEDMELNVRISLSAELNKQYKHVFGRCDKDVLVWAQLLRVDQEGYYYANSFTYEEYLNNGYELLPLGALLNN